MVLYSTEMVLALHEARIEDERRRRAGRLARTRKASGSAGQPVSLRPATAR